MSHAAGILVDRGQSVSFEKQAEEGERPNCVGVARLGSLQTSGTVFTVWLQLRGSAWVESKEGKFRLRQREWIAFEKESRPLIQAGRDGMCIGVSSTVTRCACSERWPTAASIPAVAA